MSASNHSAPNSPHPAMAFLSPSVRVVAPRPHHHATCIHRSSFIAPPVRRHRPRLPRRAPPTTAMVISSNDFRTGVTIELDGVPYKVLEFLHVKPGKGAAFVRTKLKNMATGSNIDKTFKAGQMIQRANMEKIAMQHTYVDGDHFVFMNLDTFDEERLSADQLGHNVVKFIKEGLDVQVLKHGNNVLGVEIPNTMSFEVVRTDPGVKGNTVQGGSKPAVIETGTEIMVPLFIKQGDIINVNTEDGKYAGRSND